MKKKSVNQKIFLILFFTFLLALGIALKVYADSTNDNNIDNNGGQPRHVPGEEAWSGIGFNMRNPTNVDDGDAPYFYVSVWASDITSAQLNYNVGDGWQENNLQYDSDHDYKSYWRTSAGISEIQNKSPGTTVQYDFKLIDGTAQGWLKSDGFFGSSDVGTPFSFTIEGVSAQPTTATADSSATSTISAWVTNNGTPVSGEVVTFTISSGPGAFVSTGNKTATATTNTSGMASVQIISGYSGTANIGASSTNLNDSGDTTATVTFSSFVTDGDPSDFPGDTTGISDNDSKVSEGTLIWMDALNDEQSASNIDPDPTNFSSFDIRQFRATATSDSFRLLVTFRDFISGDYPFVVAAIDTDVVRDTSFSVTTYGAGPATSTKDYGNWWLPANAFTGTKHSGAATADGRGERGQKDTAGTTSGYLPNRWTVDGAALDAGDSVVDNADTNAATVVNNTRTDPDAGTQGPETLRWDYNQHTNELYVGIGEWNAGTADYFIWVADETTTDTTTQPWSKSGNIMNSDDWRFNRGTSGDWWALTHRLGSADYDSASGGASPISVTQDRDDDNRDMSIEASGAIPLEGTVDLDDLYYTTGGIQNGDLWIITSSFGTNDGNGAWDITPQENSAGVRNDFLRDEWQHVYLERPSQTSDNQVAEWERAIAFSPINPGGGRSATAVWKAPGGRALGMLREEKGNSWASDANDAFEYDISWSDLLGGRRPPFTLRFTVGVGEGTNGAADQFDNWRYVKTRRASASGTYGEVSSLLDVVSNVTTSTELSDTDLDWFLDIDFNKDGQVNTPPDTPTNLGITQTGDTTVRQSGVILNDATPIFRWTVNDIDGSMSAKEPAWELQVDNDANFGSPAIDKQSTSSETSATEWEATSSISTGDTYYWRIRTRDDFGWSRWTASGANAFSFRINSAPNAPTSLLVDGQTNPTTLSDNLPRFSWTFSDNDPGDGQTQARIEIYNGASLVYGETVSTTNNYWDYPDTATALEGGIQYNWRVKTADLNAAWSAFSPAGGPPTTATFQIAFTSPGARDVLIAEVGQNSTTADYVMLYNPTDTTVKLAGMSLQRWSGTLGTSFAKLSFGQEDTIPAYSYFLIGLSSVSNRDDTFPSTTFISTSDMGVALMRNTETIISGDTDKIDAVAFRAGPEGEGAQLTALGTNGYFAVRKVTQNANVLRGIYGGNELHWAGNYYDQGDNATDFVRRTSGPAQDPRGRSAGPSRIKFLLSASTGSYVEENVPFTLTVTAQDANSLKVSDTAVSSMVGPFTLRVSAGSVSPSLSNDTVGQFSTGTAKDSVMLSGYLGSVTVTADTNYGVDTTGNGPINGTLTLTVQTAQAPTKPVITSPTNGSYQYNPITVVWNASTDSTPPVQYRVQVSKSDTFGTLEADTYTYSETLSIGTLSVPDTHYARVIAYDPGNNYDTSTTVQFRVVYQVSTFRLSMQDPNLLVASRTVRRGQPFNLRIVAINSSGETVTTFQDTVTLSIARGTISLTTVKFRLANNGDTTCSVTVSGGATVGADSISADSAGATTARINVIPLTDNRLVINEVLPVDINTAANADRDEWVEIANRSIETVSTSGWVITDFDAGGEYSLPAVNIPSGKKMVVHYSEIGANETDFGDTDNAAHIFPAASVQNRLSAQDEIGLYTSSTKDSSTVASYFAWANASSWSAQSDTDAFNAGLWVNDQTFNHGAASATALAGRPIFRFVDGRDTFLSATDWQVLASSETYVMTEGFSNEIFDTDLTGVAITLRSGSGSTDTVSIGETLVITLTATGGGNASVRGVTTVKVYSNADTQGIVVTLYETANSSRNYNQEIYIVNATDSSSQDGHRQQAALGSDSITAEWIKGETKAISSVPGPLDHFDISAPTNVSNDFTFSMTITARNTSGGTKEDYIGTVNLTIANGSINPTSATFISSDSGVKSVSVTISGASLGTDTITATEASTGETGNTVVTVVEPPAIVINEIMPLPAAIDWDGSGLVDANQDEWVELYNRTDVDTSLANWKVGANGTSKVTLTGTLPERGYAVVYRRTAGTARIHFFDSSGVSVSSVNSSAGALGPMNNGGDRVFLLNSAGDTIDDVTYSSMASYSDSSYSRAWDGAGVFKYPVRCTPGDSPTLPVSNRDTNANMRFRIDMPESASISESRTLYVVAIDALNDTITNFTQSGVSITASGGPTINISSISFTSGICSTSIKFSTSTGTATITVRHDTNSVGRRDVYVYQTGPQKWYINNAVYDANDSFTSAVGNDGNDGHSPATPKLTLGAVFPNLIAGETVYIDAGTFTPTDTVSIDTNPIWIYGVDSNLTIVNFNDSTQASFKSIQVKSNANGLKLSSLGVRDGYYGFYLNNVSSCSFVNVSAKFCGTDGFLFASAGSNNIEKGYALRNSGNGFSITGTSNYNYLLNCRAETNTSIGIVLGSGADTNYLDSCTAQGNNEGIKCDNSDSNLLRYNSVRNNTGAGVVFVSGSANNYFSSNTIAGNGGQGIYISTNQNWILSNTVSQSSGNGIELQFSDNHYFEGNTVETSGGCGFYLHGSSSNEFRNNISRGNTDDGFFDSWSASCTFVGNVSRQNGDVGFLFYAGSSNNLIETNQAISNTNDGFLVQEGGAGNGSNDNIFRYNLSSGNATGFKSLASHRTIFEMNQISGNTQWGINIDNWSQNTVIRKNNIIPVDTNCANIDTINQIMERNWWGTRDSSAIRNLIYGNERLKAIYIPFRLGEVETSSLADTIAPKASDSVSAFALTESTVKVEWTATSTNEENDGSAVALAGYRIYSSQDPDTTEWILRAAVSSGTTSFTDSNLSTETYYYKITSYDTSTPLENESYYGDSTAYAFIRPATIALTKTLRAVTLGGIASKPIPGATVEYELTYSNIGYSASDTVIIYDTIPTSMQLSNASRQTDTLGASATFHDTYASLGWVFEYSTSATPDQSDTSADYVNGWPGDLSTVKWIRWKRSAVSSGQSATIRFRVILQ